MGGKLIVWIFAMRILMVITSLISYFVNDAASRSLYTGKEEFDFEHPLTNLVWITSCVSIIVTFRRELPAARRSAHRRKFPFRLVGAFHHHQLRDHRRGADP